MLSSKNIFSLPKHEKDQQLRTLQKDFKSVIPSTIENNILLGAGTPTAGFLPDSTQSLIKQGDGSSIRQQQQSSGVVETRNNVQGQTENHSTDSRSIGMEKELSKPNKERGIHYKELETVNKKQEEFDQELRVNQTLKEQELQDSTIALKNKDGGLLSKSSVVLEKSEQRVKTSVNQSNRELDSPLLLESNKKKAAGSDGLHDLVNERVKSKLIKYQTNLNKLQRNYLENHSSHSNITFKVTSQMLDQFAQKGIRLSKSYRNLNHRRPLKNHSKRSSVRHQQSKTIPKTSLFYQTVEPSFISLIPPKENISHLLRSSTMTQQMTPDGTNSSEIPIHKRTSVQYSSLVGPSFLNTSYQNQVRALAGQTAVLACVINNLHNKTVSTRGSRVSWIQHSLKNFHLL